MQRSFDDILNGKHGHNKDFEITPEVSVFLQHTTKRGGEQQFLGWRADQRHDSEDMRSCLPSILSASLPIQAFLLFFWYEKMLSLLIRNYVRRVLLRY